MGRAPAAREVVGFASLRGPQLLPAPATPTGLLEAYDACLAKYADPDADYEKIGEDGRTPRRLATHMLKLDAVYDTKALTGLPFKPYLKYTHFGSRYSESTDNNVTLYPAYYHLDGGFIWDFSDKSSFQFHVSNITNQLSFTEGDPLFSDLKGPAGITNRGVARPLFGRQLRAFFTYFF